MFLEMKREATPEVDQRKSGPKEAGKEEDCKEGKKAHAFLQVLLKEKMAVGKMLPGYVKKFRCQKWDSNPRLQK